MSKVQIINKSRKEYRCKNCGAVIPIGSTYYRGEINFGPTIIRCDKCKLQPWEVTTSDYQLSVGRVCYRWKEDYGVSEDAIESISSALEDIRSELEQRLDSMPEGLQEGDVGQLLQDRIDCVDDAICEIESIDIFDIKQAVCESLYSGLSIDNQFDENLYDERMKSLSSKSCEEWIEDEENLLSSELSSMLEDQIEEALTSISV